MQAIKYAGTYFNALTGNDSRYQSKNVFIARLIQAASSHSPKFRVQSSFLSPRLLWHVNLYQSTELVRSLGCETEVCKQKNSQTFSSTRPALGKSTNKILGVGGSWPMSCRSSCSFYDFNLKRVLTSANQRCTNHSQAFLKPSYAIPKSITCVLLDGILARITNYNMYILHNVCVYIYIYKGDMYHMNPKPIFFLHQLPSFKLH